MPAVDDGATVDGEDVAVGQALGGVRDAMHDRLVDRGAYRRWIAVVTQKGRNGSGPPYFPPGYRVELAGGNSGPGRVLEDLQRAGDHQPGLTHARELLRRLDLNRRLASHPHTCTSAYKASRIEGFAGRRQGGRG